MIDLLGISAAMGSDEAFSVNLRGHSYMYGVKNAYLSQETPPVEGVGDDIGNSGVRAQMLV